MYPFHPEDDYIRRVGCSSTVLNSHKPDPLYTQFATHTLDYTLTHTQPRESDSFGLDIGGRMALIPATRLRDLAAALAEAYPQPS